MKKVLLATVVGGIVSLGLITTLAAGDYEHRSGMSSENQQHQYQSGMCSEAPQHKHHKQISGHNNGGMMHNMGNKMIRACKDMMQKILPNGKPENNRFEHGCR